MRVDVMIDIEALGKQPDSTIFQIAAIAFDINTGEHISEFNQIADLSNDKKIKVDGDTLVWWLNTNKDLLTELLNSGSCSKEVVLKNFNEWLKSLFVSPEDNTNVHLWGNGILFDNKMIQHQLNELNIDYPIHYKKDRDVRTILDLAATKLGVDEKTIKDRVEDEEFVEHDAFDDVKYQIKLVCECYKILTQ